MLRLINCQHVTMLLEQQVDRTLVRAQRLHLWLHLRYCPQCNRYAKQTGLIAEWVRASASDRATAGPVLSDAAKERMRARLAAGG